MRERVKSPIIVALAVVAGLASADPGETATAVNKGRSATASSQPRLAFLCAGVEFAPPAGFQRRRSSDPYEVFAALRTEVPGRPAMACTLTVQAVQPQASVDDLVSLIRERMLAVKNLVTTDQESLSVAGSPAVRRKARYTYRGDQAEADMVFLMVTAPGEDRFKLAYVLTVETTPAGAAALPAVRKEVLASLKLTPPVSPMDLPLSLPAEPVAVTDLGAAISVPEDWKVSVGPGTLQAFQMDYTRGGAAYPRLTAVFMPADPAMTADGYMDQAKAVAKKVFAGQALEVLEEGPAALAGAEGHQMVLRVKSEGRVLVCAQRCAVREGKCCTLALTGLTDDPAKVKAMLERFAETFVLLPSPATAPATTAPARPNDPAAQPAAAPAKDAPRSIR